MARVLASAVCFRLPQLLRRPSLGPRFISASLLSTEASQLRFAKLPVIGTQYRVSRSSSWRAMSGGNAESCGDPMTVPATVAHELIQSGYRYLDVRTPEEFGSGHAVGAINIPYMFKSGPGMAKNPKFMEEVLTKFKKEDAIVVACMAGKRSFMASRDLVSAGYKEVKDFSGGFAAWAQNGLPSET
ncbi:Thiosulfate sulfurtransferase [Bertholletia excelsa]